MNRFKRLYFTKRPSFCFLVEVDDMIGVDSVEASGLDLCKKVTPGDSATVDWDITFQDLKCLPKTTEAFRE